MSGEADLHFSMVLMVSLIPRTVAIILVGASMSIAGMIMQLNNLDMRHAIGMMHQLRRVLTELGKTVVIVPHDINFASWYSDQIIAMRDGKVVYHAGPEVVLTPQALRLHEIEVQVETICGKLVGVYRG
jgi:ABC-type enterochelin transport system ATPase subunit